MHKSTLFAWLSPSPPFGIIKVEIMAPQLTGCFLYGNITCSFRQNRRVSQVYIPLMTPTIQTACSKNPTHYDHAKQCCTHILNIQWEEAQAKVNGHTRRRTSGSLLTFIYTNKKKLTEANASFYLYGQLHHQSKNIHFDLNLVWPGLEYTVHERNLLALCIK